MESIDHAHRFWCAIGVASVCTLLAILAMATS